MKRTMVRALMVAALAGGVAGCSEKLEGAEVTGLQSFRVALRNPVVDPVSGTVGKPDAPVDVSQVTFDLDAIGPDGKRWAKACAVDQDCCPPGMDCSRPYCPAGMDCSVTPAPPPACGGEVVADHPTCQEGVCAYDLEIFLSFGGNKVGQVTACGTDTDKVPVRRIHLCGGFAQNITVPLVKAFGAAAVWIEEASTAALGTSPAIYFASPTIPDVQTPLDFMSSTFTWCSPWNGRHVIINRASVDPVSKQRGNLVVTSVFGSAYVVADTGANFDPQKDTGGFNHMYVFTFGRPDSNLSPGQPIASVSGNVSKFIGFTELNFPIQEFDYRAAKVPLPPVYELQKSDRGQNLRLLRLAASTVKAHGNVCNIVMDDQWIKFNQFVLDLGDNICDAFSSFAVELPSKTFGGFDPTKLMGQKQQIAVTGMLKNSSGQNEACKGVKDAPAQVDCRTKDDCDKAATDDSNGLPPLCRVALMAKSVQCVEGTCRRGAYNFWTIIPRTPADISTN